MPSSRVIKYLLLRLLTVAASILWSESIMLDSVCMTIVGGISRLATARLAPLFSLRVSADIEN